MAFEPTNRFDKPWTPNNRTWINYLTPIVTPPVPPSTDNTRTPLFTRIVAAAWVAAVLIPLVPNLNTSTLAEQGPPPQAPFYQTEWPNPRGPIFPVSLRTHLHNAQTQLIGRDQFFGAPGEAPRYDYPNPRGPTRNNPDFIGQNLAQTTLVPAAPVQDPFKPVDFPNPQQSRRNPQYTFNAQVHLIGQDALPNRQRDWQNPITARRGQDFTGQNLLVTTLAPVIPAGTPFFQSDWPNPRGPTGVFRATSNIYHRNADLPPPPAAGTPFYQTDWQNPPRKTYDLTTHSLQIRLPAEETQSIFTYDWPNPKGKAYPVELRTWTNGDLLTTTLSTPPVALPQGKTAFPEPRGALFSIELRSWIKPAQVQLIGKDALPFRQRDWQNPQTPRRLTALSWTHPVTHLLPLPPALPPGKALFHDHRLVVRTRSEAITNVFPPGVFNPPAPPPAATGTKQKRKWRRSGATGTGLVVERIYLVDNTEHVLLDGGGNFILLADLNENIVVVDLAGNDLGITL